MTVWIPWRFCQNASNWVIPDLCGVAAIGSVINASFDFNSISHGYGNHLWDIRASAVSNGSIMRKWQCANLMCTLIMYLIKVSILIQYHRIFAVSSRLRTVIIYGAVVITIAYVATFGTQIGSLIQCNNGCGTAARSFQVCFELVVAQVVQSLLAAITDFFILILPIKTISGLQLCRHKKVGVLAIFCTGLVACLASVGRLISIIMTYHFDMFYTGAIASALT